MACFVIDLNSDTLSAVFKEDISIAVFLVNIGEMILRIKKRRFFYTESIGEKFYEQV